MLLIEADVGITEFLGGHSAFRAILKQQLDDFIVNEIQPDGTVVRQKSCAFPGDETQDAVNQKRVGTGPVEEKRAPADDVPANFHPDAPDYEMLDNLFPSVTPKPSDEIKSLVLDCGSEYVFPPISDKAQRTVLHNWVKTNLTMYISDTVQVDDNTNKAVRIRKRMLLRPWKRRRRGDPKGTTSDASRTDTFDPRDSRSAVKRSKLAENDPYFVNRNTYVSFTLWKRGRDTNEALSSVAAVLRLNQNSLTHAGTKDKRAVTTQMIRLRGVSIRSLVSVNNASGMFHRGRRCVSLGDFKVLSGSDNRPLSLGDLKGNRFTLVLRDISISSDAEKQNVRDSIESVKNQGFINYYGLQRFGSGVSPTHETGYAVLKGDFKGACLRILTPLKIVSVEGDGRETQLRPERKQMEEALQNYADGKCSAKQLFDNLPKWMTIERTIVQSFAENESAGRPLDYKSAFGKLPRNLKKIYGHAVQSYLWNCMASKRVSMYEPGDPGRRFAVAGDIIAIDREADIFSFTTKIRYVTETEEKEQSISIENVLIPVIGSDVTAPDSETGQIAKEILLRNGVDMNSLPSEYGLKGTYRRLICKPENFECTIKAYNSKDRYPLVHLTGTGVEVVEKKNADSDATQSSERANNSVRVQNTDEDKHALIISFSLGHAAYATMLTRELTRSDTSTLHQKFLQESSG